MFFLDNIWLIPLIPLFGSLLMLLFGRRLDPQNAAAAGHGHDDHGGHHGSPLGHTLISWICPGAIGLTFLFSLAAVFQLSDGLHGIFWNNVFQKFNRDAIPKSWNGLFQKLSNLQTA